ncbi:isoprenylcysteine carboxyl methyltransferase [Actinoplanes sp. ATCC 53533]|uniref:methyltransferase family protein n=1 Tax=Actinoplanes sp. ATCC 53533 TaxID=1288362 RepID=UPI000F785105|nr:isoprenylcysteine carboxylmethyltransferase family protein [Actinoplanes sp. ATCC 53533]RSM60073.1 isoprenylcysteine carboxyl methyltransferase [Actinoplanes sp. ATCC 53533]
MAAAALTIYLLGLTLAFGWRSIVQWRRTGDTGLRLDAGPVGTLRWWAKLLFVVALLLGAAGPIAAIAGLPALDAFDHPVTRGAGLILAVAGVLTTLVSQLHMGTSWRIGVDPGEHTDLVTTRVFALARNPIFTAMTATSLGITLMAPNVVSVAATAILVMSIQLQVRAVEEPYLTRVHGAAYTTYTARTGRFLPGIGRLTAPAGTAPRDRETGTQNNTPHP